MREAQAGQPVVANPLVVHVPVGEGGPGGGGGRGRGEGDHLLDGQPQLEPVQGVADPNLALDLGVGERGHDGPGLDIGPASSDIPEEKS